MRRRDKMKKKRGEEKKRAEEKEKESGEEKAKERGEEKKKTSNQHKVSESSNQQKSICQATLICCCKGWKNPSLASGTSDSESTLICRNCNHTIDDHYVANAPESKVNDDLERLNSEMLEEKDMDAKNVYLAIRRVLLKDSEMIENKIELLYGSPPFENPSILQAVPVLGNIYAKTVPKPRKLVTKMVKTFIKGFNKAHLEKVENFVNSYKETNIAIYKFAYSRWLAFCYIPTYCKSLPRYQPADVFGLNVLMNMISFYKNKIITFGNNQQGKAGIDLTDFISNLEKEASNSGSEIWRPLLDPKRDTPTSARILEIVTDPSIMFAPEPSSIFTRDKLARRKEREGHIQLHMISNCVSQQPENCVLVWLMEVKNLFCQQLPFMPPLYITRVVFDPRHRSLVLVENEKVIGGICFRMFPTQDFSEIVFLAVSACEQVKGYGTHMMNHLKNYHSRKNVHNFLTYADHSAVGYFEKQGFSSRITLPENVYTGYIKHYEGATLMECHIDSRINYTEISSILNKQKLVVKKLIEQNRALLKKPETS